MKQQQVMTNAEPFASRGDVWAGRHPHPSTGLSLKRISAFNGGGLTLVDEVEGYDQPEHGPHAAIHRPEVRIERRPGINDAARLEFNEQRRIERLLRNPFK